MNSLLLNLMPSMMAKYEYTRALLQWTGEFIEGLKAHKTTFRYPLIDPLLLSSLEKAACDLGSVPLLRFVSNLRSLNVKLEKTNENPEDTSRIIDTFFGLKDEIPKLDIELKCMLVKYAAKTAFLFTSLVLVVVFLRCK